MVQFVARLIFCLAAPRRFTMENLDLLSADTVRALFRLESQRLSEPPTPADATMNANVQAIVSMSMRGAGEAVKKVASCGFARVRNVLRGLPHSKTASAVSGGVAKFMLSAKGGYYADVLGANRGIAERGVLR